MINDLSVKQHLGSRLWVTLTLMTARWQDSGTEGETLHQEEDGSLHH